MFSLSSLLVCILMFLQISYVANAGQFAIIPPKNPVIGSLGKEVMLPCQLTTSNISESSITVTWIFDKSSQKINVGTYIGENKEETSDIRYQGRAELSHRELSKGNMSLILKNSQLTDEGRYVCMVHLGNWYDEVFIDLLLTAKGAEPAITMLDYKSQGIGFTCSSEGWYPKPQALWLNSKGGNRTEKSNTTNTQTAVGTFSVFSSITIQPGGDNELSCKIINNLLQLESESRILVSDVFYPATPSWLPPFIIILLLFICLAIFAVYKLKESYENVSQAEKQKNKIKSDRDHLKLAIESEGNTTQASLAELKTRFDVHTNELDIRRLQHYAAAFTLDSDYKHPGVIISEDQKKASFKTLTAGQPEAALGSLIVVGKEGYAAGKHYWEVKVGGRSDWELGVLTKSEKEKAKNKKFVGPLGDGCWALRSVGGDLFSNRDENKIEKKDVSFSVIGMLLDEDEGKISFYNAEIKFLINSIPIEAIEKLYPFLGFGKTGENGSQCPLEIIQIPVPIPFKNL
ncbi:butyrophilin subfamily 3 member A2-like [Elgaria multicarinata webbii]|uniref:butyrophilin subfamily 3 member A2-like n=1 Tax=Elgaria multicarinata webbii TaxID=159646 RepID=UPI002FCD255D